MQGIERFAASVHPLQLLLQLLQALGQGLDFTVIDIHRQCFGGLARQRTKTFLQVCDGPLGTSTVHGDIEIGDPGVVISDKAIAASELARFQTDYKEAKKKKDHKRRAELILKLGEKDHPSIYKALTKFVKDKEYRVATAAVVSVSFPRATAALTTCS